MGRHWSGVRLRACQAEGGGHAGGQCAGREWWLDAEDVRTQAEPGLREEVPLHSVGPWGPKKAATGGLQEGELWAAPQPGGGPPRDM